MLSYFTTFAGPICLNPTTERESFIWGLVIGAFLLVVISILFGLAALIVKIRHTYNPGRKLWAKRYGLSILAFFLLIGLGWLTGTGGSSNDYCHTAESSFQGGIFSALATIAGLAAPASLIGFIFSFTSKTK